MEWLAEFVTWLSVVGTDKIIAGIVKNNMAIGGLLVAVFAVVAKRTKTTLDDDILAVFKNRKKNNV